MMAIDLDGIAESIIARKGKIDINVKRDPASEIADLRVDLATAEARATAAEDHARELASRLAAAESALAVERSRPRPAPVVNAPAAEPAAYEVVVTDRDDKGRLKKLSMVPR